MTLIRAQPPSLKMRGRGEDFYYHRLLMACGCVRDAVYRKCECVNIEMKINFMEYCKWLYQINAVTFTEVLFVQSN